MKPEGHVMARDTDDKWKDTIPNRVTVSMTSMLPW